MKSTFEREVEVAVKTAQNLNLTKVLYDLKAKGKCPKITVTVEKGEVVRAYLSISGMRYYFHETMQDGKKIKVEKKKGLVDKDVFFYELPFDGWEMSLMEE